MIDKRIEIWKAVPGYEGLYEASSFGRVKSLGIQKHSGGGVYYFLPGRIMKTRKYTRYGHTQLCLYKDGIQKDHRVHHLVLKTFIGARPDGLQCRHLDGDATNNHASNLCWGTAKENTADMMRHGTWHQGPCKGVENGRSKVTEKQVLSIRQDTRTLKDISEDYGISLSQISSIRTRVSWRHI